MTLKATSLSAEVLTWAKAKRGFAGEMIRRGIATALLLSLFWLLPPYFHQARHLCPTRPDGIAQALGLPAFARKYGMSCSQCHSNYPTPPAMNASMSLIG